MKPICIQSSVVPDDQPSFNQWARLVHNRTKAGIVKRTKRFFCYEYTQHGDFLRLYPFFTTKVRDAFMQWARENHGEQRVFTKTPIPQ
jgi:hypothetical protein